MRLAAAAIAALLFLCPPAFAGEDHGPPPSVGMTIVPTLRITCEDADSLASAFAGGHDLDSVNRRLVALQAAGFCERLLVVSPLTITEVRRVGQIVFPDGDLMDVYVMTGRFESGNEIWQLWLQDIPGSPA